MDEVQIAWEETTAEGNQLRVPLHGETDHIWGEQFARQESLWRSETRGQTWDLVEWMGDALVIVGVDEDTTTQGLRTYVEQLITSTNTNAARERQRLAAEKAEQETEQERKASHASRLADDLRRSGS